MDPPRRDGKKRLLLIEPCARCATLEEQVRQQQTELEKAQQQNVHLIAELKNEKDENRKLSKELEKLKRTLSDLLDSPEVETDKEVHIYNSLGNMSTAMQDDAVAIAQKAIHIQVAPTNLQMACYITLEFKKKMPFGTKWHCIVGTDFDSDVTNMGLDLLHFRVGRRVFLLFKTA